MSQAEEGHAGGNKKAGYVKSNLDFGVRLFNDLGEISWKQVCWDDREFAAVGKGDTEAEYQVACHKVKYPKGNGKRQSIDPDLMDIDHFSESETCYKAEQVAGNKAFFYFFLA